VINHNKISIPAVPLLVADVLLKRDKQAMRLLRYYRQLKAKDV